MGYTDSEMRAFSQVAYADLDEAFNYLHTKMPDRKSFSVTELRNAAEALGVSNDKLKMLNVLSSEQCDNWRISAIHDTNASNGFYACVIETEPGNAVLAFRGSESHESMTNLVNDWGKADFGLLNSLQTNQQSETERFLYQHRDLINSYDNIALTGHSLGGNLAQHATLVSHRYGFDGKITQSVSLDGPGFSNEYIAFHMQDILRMKDVMTHYQWSPVGGLLFSLPFISRRTVKVSNEANKIDDDKMDAFTRHDTKYLEFDDKGNLKDGEMNMTGNFLSWLSKSVEISSQAGSFQLVIMSLTFFLDAKLHFDDFISKALKQAKITYKDLVEKFKRAFAAHDFYKVNTNRLSNDTRDVRAEMDRTRAYVNEMFENVKALNTMWRGPAASAFVSKFASEREQIIKYINHIEKYVVSLEHDRDNYNRCENRVSSIVSGLRF